MVLRRSRGGGPWPEGSDRRIRSILVLGGVPFSEVEDALQQVHLKVVERTTKRPPLHDTLGWAVVVASRIALDWHRSQERDRGLVTRLEARWLGGELSKERSADDVALEMLIAKGMDSITRIQRQILVLRFYEDLQVSEIADILNVPTGTVKSRLYGAVAALREYLHKSGVDLT